jgi:hypothetical protein
MHVYIYIYIYIAYYLCELLNQFKRWWILFCINTHMGFMLSKWKFMQRWSIYNFKMHVACDVLVNYHKKFNISIHIHSSNCFCSTRDNFKDIAWLYNIVGIVDGTYVHLFGRSNMRATWMFANFDTRKTFHAT